MIASTITAPFAAVSPNGEEPIYFADFVHDYPKIGGVVEYSARLLTVLRAQYGDRVRSLRAMDAELGGIEWRLPYLDRERLALQRLAVRHPNALVVVPNFQSPVSSHAPCRLRTINIIHDVPFGRLDGELSAEYLRWLDGRYAETAANADHIGFVSEATRRDFLARYAAPRSHSIIAPVMDAAPAAPCEVSRENFLLVVSHYEDHDHKNFAGIVDVFARLAARDATLQLVMTGRGRDLFQASIAARDPTLRARIDHRGYVPRSDLENLYRRARALVSLSRFEGFDMPSAEAALHGLPLILSDLPVRRELFGDSACLVDPSAPSIAHIEAFLAAPLIPRPRIAHTMPAAVGDAIGRAIAKLGTPRATLTKRDDPARGVPAWLVRSARATLLASTLAATSAFYLASATPSWAAVFPGIGGPPVNGTGGYYNSISPLDVLSSAQATVRLANDRQGLMVTNSVLASMLRGINEQINCTNCFTGFGAVGSVSAGFHGRKQLTQDLSIVGGVSFNQYRSGGVSVTSAPILAALFRYDLTELGSSRPFFEFGGVLSPAQRVTSTRNYGAGIGTALGRSTTSVTSGSVFGRVGWLWRLSPRDEVAAAFELSQGWQRFGGFAEGGAGLPSNPIPLSPGAGVDRMGVVKLGGQWTHLLTERVETQFNLGIARSFGSRSGLNGTLGTRNLLGEHVWAEYGARLGYRIQQNFIIDVFADGTLGGRPIGNTVHGGVAARYAF